MKKRMMAFLLSFVMVLTMVLQPMAVQAAETTANGSKVITPASYDDNHAYPVIYVMPEDGKTEHNSGLSQKLQAAMDNGTCTPMIIVETVFTTDDLHAEIADVVAEIDAEYNTVADAAHRAIVGTEVGGYLAYILGMTEMSAPAAEVEEVVEAVVEEEAEEVVEEEAEEVVEEETAEEVAEEETAEEVAEEETTEEVAEEEVVEEVVEEAAVEEVAVVAEEAAAPEVTTLTAPNLFKYVISTRGDFVSEANTWYATYGDVYSHLKAMGSSAVGKFYTYMDAPVADTYTDMEGSTNDIGHMMIGFGLAANVCEFTVRSESLDAFFTESTSRIANRLTSAMLSGTVSGSVSLAKPALSADVEYAEVSYSVKANFGTYSSSEEMTIVVSSVDTDGTVLASTEEVKTVANGETVTGKLNLENVVNGSSSTVQLSAKVLGTELKVATTTLVRIQETVVDGDYQYADLMGDWYFHFTGNKTGLDVTSLLATKEYEAWPIVQPALTSWTKGFGDVTSSLPGSYFDYGIIGDGYYVRTFDLPADFDAEDLVLSIGYMDDRGEVFVNGQFVGATGMKDGVSVGETTWAVYSAYEIDPSVLNLGGTNTIVVRCQNDGMGGGGWYGGPVALYSKTAYESDDSTSSLFIEQTFESKYAASAQGLEGTVENEYLVYLPEGYWESDKYYPTVYMMHQFNSDHTSYIIDDVDTLIDEAIKQALIDEMIVIVPNSDENSWWRGDWEKMVTEELIPLIDSEYATIKDARYRFTAGCSMGGQGAMSVALTNPDLFSGAISFFGAFSYGGDLNPDKIAQAEGADFMNYYSLYFICGNQDSYKFGQPAIQFHQTLLGLGVDHEFFIDNGEHNSAFYVPHFIEAFVYTRNNMYQSDEAVLELLSGALEVSEDGTIKGTFEALEGIEEYYNQIPASSYTENGTPDLSIPLMLVVEQNGEVMFSVLDDSHVINADDLTEEFECNIADSVDLDAEYTITYKAYIFDRVVELASVTMNEPEEPGTEEPGTEEPGTSVKPSDKPTGTTKPSGTTSVQTGDNTSVTLYIVVLAAAVVAMAAVVVYRKKRA